MSLSIVHVVRQYSPSVGGLESVVARLASLQSQRFAYDVRVVTLDRIFKEPDLRLDAHEVIDGVSVTRLPWTGSSRYSFCPRVLGAIAGADLVHVHGIDFFYDFLAVTRWLHGRPLVASTHGGFFHTTYASMLKRIWFNSVTRLSSLAYRRVFATSDHDGQVFRRIAGKRVAVVENGADLDRNRNAASKQTLSTIIFFGRWSSNKGIDRLLALFAKLRESDSAWRLILAGRPFDLTRRDLEGQCRELAIGSSVEIHEAPSDDELRGLMTRASYFACMSRYEGFGIAAIEAMSAGLVPLLSDIPPFRKIVEGSGCGLLIGATEDPEQASSAVLLLHANLQESTGGQRDRAMAFAQRYDWPSVADRMDQHYQAVLRKGPAASAAAVL